MPVKSCIHISKLQKIKNLIGPKTVQLPSIPLKICKPDFSSTACNFILATDARSVAAGAMLSQKQQGDEKVIAYDSRVFSTAEKNYSATERELAAITWAVKHFKSLLYGRNYIIRTDHKQLIYLANMKDIDSKLMKHLGI